MTEVDLSHEPDYSRLLLLMVRLINGQAGRPIESERAWEADTQNLAIKLFRHLVAMRTVYAEAVLSLGGRQEIAFVDHASVKVLARAALETYLVFAYIYAAETEGDAEFRYKAWRLGGLCDRQAHQGLSDETREKQQTEASAIAQLRAQLEATDKFQKGTAKYKRAILDGKWRTGMSWSDLGVQAGLHKSLFDNVYRYLCGYSHSSWASVLQVRDASRSIHDQRELASTAMLYGVIIMAYFLDRYASRFPSAREYLFQHPSDAAMIASWKRIAWGTGLEFGA